MNNGFTVSIIQFTADFNFVREINAKINAKGQFVK